GPQGARAAGGEFRRLDRRNRAVPRGGRRPPAARPRPSRARRVRADHDGGRGDAGADPSRGRLFRPQRAQPQDAFRDAGAAREGRESCRGRGAAGPARAAQDRPKTGEMMDFNWLAVGLAALATFMLGGLWYSPALFARAWMRETGLSEEAARAG